LVEVALQLFAPNRIPVSFLLNTFAADILPPSAQELVPQLNEQLCLIETEEKFEAMLAKEPEPDPAIVDQIIKLVDGSLAKVRDHFVGKAELLPANRGGREKKLATAEERSQVIEEVKSLRGPGVKLVDIFIRIGMRREVSASKIKQIWQEAKLTAKSLK
jgi:hypothetical protein